MAGAWMWVAHAVWQADGGSLTPPAAQAALAGGSDALTSTWEPPLPAYRPESLPPAPVPPSEAALQVARLREHTDDWEHLDDDVRRAFDAAAARHPARKAGWQQIVVEGTGEPLGSAKDLTFSASRSAAETSIPHFVIGNGSRAGDGSIEATGRPLDGDHLLVSLVGDFSRVAPSDGQLRALTELVDYARAKTGIIPVMMGEASRAPITASVLDAAYNQGIPVRPIPEPAPH